MTNVEQYADGWRRRRISRDLLTTFVIGATAILDAGDGGVGWLIVAVLLVLVAYDLHVSARRELKQLAKAPSLACDSFTARELKFLRWAELTAYLAAFAELIRIVRRPPLIIDAIAVSVFLGVALFLRFGLQRSAKRSGVQLHYDMLAPRRQTYRREVRRCGATASRDRPRSPQSTVATGGSAVRGSRRSSVVLDAVRALG
jgi:hypothetical protein